MRWVLRHLEDRAAQVLRLWLIVGILLRVTRVRDRFPGLSLVFYSTPWPVMAAAFIGLAVHYWRRGNRHAVRRYAAFTVVALFTWVATSWYSTPVTDAPPDLRFIHWNVGRPEEGLFGCAKWLRAQDPDIICLAESRPKEFSNPQGRGNLDLWISEFPGYAVKASAAGMLLLVRGEILESHDGILSRDSYFALHRLRVRGHAVNVLQVDLIARPTASRHEPITRLTEITEKTGGNLIISGDFNSPRESYHLGPLRQHFAHAFEAAGHGFAETWPSLAPALSLDQVWLSPSLKPLSCENRWTIRSDHRPVVVTMAFGAP